MVVVGLVVVLSQTGVVSDVVHGMMDFAVLIAVVVV